MTTFAEDKELENFIAKAQVLMEALPYIQRFHDATVVIKYGGHAMIDPKLKTQVMQDIVLMESVGIKPVIVHGGGPEITALMDRVGLEARFIDGQRVTDAATVDIAEMVLAGKLNKVIADDLGITMRTVEVHRAHVFEKMAVRTAVELAQLMSQKRG